MHLRVDMHLGRPATMPCREQHTAATALVLHVLEGVHDIRNASQAEKAAETESPGMCGISNLKSTVRHSPLSTSRAVRWRRTPVQRGDGRGVLVDGAALLLGRHAWVLLAMLEGALLLGSRERALRVLGRGRPRVLLLLGLAVHLALLVLSVGVLVVDGGLLLAGDVGRLGVGRVLVHGDTLLLHCDGGVAISCLKEELWCDVQVQGKGYH